MPRMPQEAAASFRAKKTESGSAKPTASSAPKDCPKHKYSSQLSMLSACFPDWNEDDLISVLVDLNGDVELAAHRISEGIEIGIIHIYVSIL